MTAPHDAPDARHLVEAVREFLESDVLGATEGRVQFHTRVAINALRTVERELAAGVEMAASHEERLLRLGFADESDLAAAIRSGALDDRYDEVKAAVWDTVRDKLRVANPKYLEG